MGKKNQIFLKNWNYHYKCEYPLLYFLGGQNCQDSIKSYSMWKKQIYDFQSVSIKNVV
jgi:predicted alpha/beta superfamily hydrolase